MSENDKQGRGLDVGSALIIELIFFSIIGIIGFNYFTSELYDTFCIGFIAVPYICIVLSALLHTYSIACPACQRIFIVEQLYTEKMSQKTGYETVVREEKNNQGDVVRSWKEQVRVRYTEYKDHYKCLNCDSHWSKDRTIRREDFTDND